MRTDKITFKRMAKNLIISLKVKERTTEMNDLYRIGDEDDNTHVA